VSRHLRDADTGGTRRSWKGQPCRSAAVLVRREQELHGSKREPNLTFLHICININRWSTCRRRVSNCPIDVQTSLFVEPPNFKGRDQQDCTALSRNYGKNRQMQTSRLYCHGYTEREQGRRRSVGKQKKWRCVGNNSLN
jgi:hypothetical protein